mmetsp:Transcript_10778/g.35391  ORF Transcript_10778/g.35391 Transcript_10778/m.35391 type:complete len:222 (-) Transcript_10778:455-1120(-)
MISHVILCDGSWYSSGILLDCLPGRLEALALAAQGGAAVSRRWEVGRRAPLLGAAHVTRHRHRLLRARRLGVPRVADPLSPSLALARARAQLVFRAGIVRFAAAAPLLGRELVRVPAVLRRGPSSRLSLAGAARRVRLGHSVIGGAAQGTTLLLSLELGLVGEPDAGAERLTRARLPAQHDAQLRESREVVLLRDAPCPGENAQVAALGVHDARVEPVMVV